MLFIHQMTEEEKKKNTFAFRFVFIAIISLTSLIWSLVVQSTNRAVREL